MHVRDYVYIYWYYRCLFTYLPVHNILHSPKLLKIWYVHLKNILTDIDIQHSISLALAKILMCVHTSQDRSSHINILSCINFCSYFFGSQNHTVHFFFCEWHEDYVKVEHWFFPPILKMCRASRLPFWIGKCTHL